MARGRRLVAFGRIRGGLLNDPRYQRSRESAGGDGSDEFTAPAASLMMEGKPWLPLILPRADTAFSQGDKRHFLGLYAEFGA